MASRLIPQFWRVLSRVPYFSHANIRTCQFSSTPRCFEKNHESISDLFVPLQINPTKNVDETDIGESMCGKLKRKDIVKTMQLFFKRSEIRIAAEEVGVDRK